jgi:DNA-binding transcriptional regulator YiaG
MTIEDTVAIAEARVRVARGDLAEIRRLTGLSQEAIGRAVGAARPTVLRWEQGQRRPTGEAAVRLAQLMRELDCVIASGGRKRKGDTRRASVTREGGDRV